MKQIIFVVIQLIFFNAHANSNWQFVTISTANDITYVDGNSYQKTGDSITFWRRVNFGERDEVGDLSSKSQSTINCRTRENIRRFLMTYDDIDNNGKLTHSAVSKDSWRPIAPDTINWAVMRHVCK